jgi:energy-coupling factor transport system permease protein
MLELLYTPGKGLLYALDPRAKLVFVLSLTLYLALVSSTEVMLLVLVGLNVLGAVSRSTRTRVPALWRGLVPLLLMIVVLGSLRWRAEDALLAVGPLTVAWPSLWMAVGLAGRIAALSFVFSLVLWTTEPGDMVAGLSRLGLPFEIGFPAVMALEYVATFGQRFHHILEAQQSRGLTLPRGNPIRTARTYLPVLIPLIITALRSADNLALALQARGFGVKAKRTSRRTLRLRPRDGVFTVATWCALLALHQFASSQPVLPVW